MRVLNEDIDFVNNKWVFWQFINDWRTSIKFYSLSSQKYLNRSYRYFFDHGTIFSNFSKAMEKLFSCKSIMYKFRIWSQSLRCTVESHLYILISYALWSPHITQLQLIQMSIQIVIDWCLWFYTLLYWNRRKTLVKWWLSVRVSTRTFNYRARFAKF